VTRMEILETANMIKLGILESNLMERNDKIKKLKQCEYVTNSLKSLSNRYEKNIIKYKSEL
jgi:hypothetical protein